MDRQKPNRTTPNSTMANTERITVSIHAVDSNGFASGSVSDCSSDEQGQERQILEQQVKALESQLEALRKRLEELSK